jgi:hypothetical protein
MSAPDWNAVRYSAGSRGGHVESYFIKANDPSMTRAIWLKATIFASTSEPERPLAEGWAIAFDRGAKRNVAVKHTLPLGDATFGADGLGIRWNARPERAGGEPESLEMSGEARAISTRGRITAQGHAIGWELALRGDAPPIVPFFAPAMYRARFPKSKLVTPMPDARVAGHVVVDGERWEIDGWRGMQGHNWGRGHADLYAWTHGNLWDEEADFVLEAVSARVRVGPVLSPLTTLVCARHRGVAYDFVKPLELLRASGDVGKRSYHFAATSALASIEGFLEAETEDMVGLHYANPDGPMTYCLNSKLARARVRFEAVGRAPLTLTSRAAALEIGTRDADHGVRMAV